MRKMNWGYKILIVILAFVAGMTFMVVLAFRQDVNMVDENYYHEEMSYQTKIDAANNLTSDQQNSLGKVENGNLIFHFEPEHLTQKQKIRLEFICYSNPEKDTILDLIVPNKRLVVKPFNKGLFKMRSSWSVNEKDYYLEKDVWL